MQYRVNQSGNNFFKYFHPLCLKQSSNLIPVDKRKNMYRFIIRFLNTVRLVKIEEVGRIKRNIIVERPSQQLKAYIISKFVVRVQVGSLGDVLKK